jgi:hypothetical protein
MDPDQLNQQAGQRGLAQITGYFSEIALAVRLVDLFIIP